MTVQSTHIRDCADCDSLKRCKVHTMLCNGNSVVDILCCFVFSCLHVCAVGSLNGGSNAMSGRSCMGNLHWGPCLWCRCSKCKRKSNTAGEHKMLTECICTSAVWCAQTDHCVCMSGTPEHWHAIAPREMNMCSTCRCSNKLASQTTDHLASEVLNVVGTSQS
jgi:hypothetical protein